MSWMAYAARSVILGEGTAGGIHLRLVALVTALLMISTPAAFAGPPVPGEKGLANACGRATSNQPCELLGVIPDTTVPAGESRSYSNGSFFAQGTVVVAGSATVDNATITFGADSGGFLVLSGGSLTVTRGTLREDTAGSCFRVLAEPGSTLRMTLSSVTGGCGVEVQTTTATVEENTLSEIAVALRLTNTNITARYNVFQNNTVAVNQTGGEPALLNNAFHGGEVCVQNWLTHPVVSFNTFRGCHVGIHHHRSHSALSNNDMEDQYVPPGGGIIVENTMSPLIENNTIRHYGTGIIVINARAWINNNTISDNVGDGVYVESNTGDMYITNNTISGNGGDGIELQNVLDILVAANNVSGNGGDGIHAGNGSRLRIEDNQVSANGGDGIESSTLGVVVEDNAVATNALAGIRLDVGASGAAVQRNHVSASGQDGFVVRGDNVSFADNVAAGNGASGFRMEAAIDASFFYDNASGNALDGFAFVDTSGSGGTGLLAAGNGRHGFHMFGMTSVALNGATADSNGADGYHVNATSVSTILYSRAFANAQGGVVNLFGNNTVATSGWYEGNLGAGVANFDESVWIDARFSYWGDPDGPTTSPTNAQGDAVVGNVLYEPYAESPPSPPLLLIESSG